MNMTRRNFIHAGLAGLPCISLAGTHARLFAEAAQAAAAADRNDHVLVVVELAGGNDGLNTLIPLENALYYNNRKTLAIAKQDAVRLNDAVGLHPSLAAMGELFKQGRLAIVQGVGYPNPDRSHFRSMEIWQTASIDKRPPAAGWLGRFLDRLPPAPDDRPSIPGLALTGELPQGMRAGKVSAPVVGQLDQFAGLEEGGQPRHQLRRKLGAASTPTADPVNFLRGQMRAAYRTADLLKDAAAKYKSPVEYPASGLGEQLKRAAQILSGNLGVRVVFASQDGYDTHAGQLEPHAALLSDLAAGLAAFDRDLTALGLADRVVVMTFSEFGRRVAENASGGTDHGAASCLFLQGAPVKGGCHGQYPSLAELDDGDLVFNTDFRRVYGALLAWLGCPATPVLGAEFAALELL